MSNHSALEHKLLNDIAAADDETALEVVRVGALGKKGAVSALLASLGKMAPDERKTAGDYRAVGVPVTYLLDRRGRMLAGKTGARHWDGANLRTLIRTAIGANR